MSNRRKLKLRPATLPYTPAATDVGLDQPRPGDAAFPPRMLQPEDIDLPGLRRRSRRRPHLPPEARRPRPGGPVLRRAGPLIAEGLRAVQLRMSAGQN